MQHEDDAPPQDHQVDEHAKRSFLKRLSDRREKAKAGFVHLKEHLAQEKDETKEMLEIYHRAAEGKATREEIHRANEQFGDLLRLAGMGTFFTLIPGSTLLLPIAVIGGNKLGIRILPSAFSGDSHEDEQDEPTASDDEPS
ncbi:MAG: hypothetical protein P8I74_01715 [Phycisphaerales bacterium]|nr:hypothetical protein [Phycisphaerales bacterium]